VLLRLLPAGLSPRAFSQYLLTYSTRDDDEIKHYKTGIAKWDGVRGETWRVFKGDIVAAARGTNCKDDRNTFLKNMLGMDHGGAAPGAPALPAGDAAATKQDIRRGQTFTWLYEHVACAKVRQILQDIASGAEPAEGIAKAAWDLLLREGEDDNNDLELEEQNEAWEGLTISNSVGIKLTSINDFRRVIDIMDAKRPGNQRKDENAKARKLLTGLLKDGPPALVSDAAN
jgi:hypothetical protein